MKRTVLKARLFVAALVSGILLLSTTWNAVAEAPLADNKQPSAQLLAFSTSWLEKLLGPLDNSPLPRAQLMQMRTEFAARLSGTSALEKQELEAALQVCNAFGNIMDAREKALASITGVQANSTAASGNKKRALTREAKKDEAFLSSAAVNTANAQWKQQQVSSRDAIQQFLIAEKRAEVAATAATAPAKPSPPTTAVVTPPASATPASVPTGSQELGALLRDTTWLMGEDGKYHRRAPGDNSKSWTLRADGTTTATWHKHKGFWKVTGPHTVDTATDAKGTVVSLTFDDEAQTATVTPPPKP